MFAANPAGARSAIETAPQRRPIWNLTAGRIHRGQFAPAQELHGRGQPAAPGEPGADRWRIDVDQRLRGDRAGDAATMAVVVPRGMKAENGIVRHADLLARKDAEHHGAGRQAWPVDDDLFAGLAHRGEA